MTKTPTRQVRCGGAPLLLTVVALVGGAALFAPLVSAAAAGQTIDPLPATAPSVDSESDSAAEEVDPVAVAQLAAPEAEPPPVSPAPPTPPPLPAPPQPAPAPAEPEPVVVAQPAFEQVAAPATPVDPFDNGTRPSSGEYRSIWLSACDEVSRHSQGWRDASPWTKWCDGSDNHSTSYFIEVYSWACSEVRADYGNGRERELNPYTGRCIHMSGAQRGTP